MEVYLIQHAESKPKDEDPERPLTDEGLKNIKRVASYSRSSLSINVRQILHSGKLRAKQTAEILAGYLNPPEGIIATDELDPMADPAIWAKRIAEIKDNIMLVGHLPHLGRLASLLLCGNEDLNVVAFQNACIVKLVSDDKSNWKLRWLIAPSII
jgi:phosphohistidine phosphatase